MSRLFRRPPTATAEATADTATAEATADTTTAEATTEVATTNASTYVFSRRLRLAGAAYVAATIPLCGLLARGTEGKQAFVTDLAVTASVYALPGLVIALVAERRAVGDRVARRLWALGFASLFVLTWLLQQEVTHGLTGLQRVLPSLAVGTILLTGAANAIVFRARSGLRTPSVDVAETTMATLALTVPVLLVVAEPILTSANALYATVTALTAVGAVHATVVAVGVVAKVPPDHRATAVLGVATAAAALVDNGAGTVWAVHDFTLPAPPAIMLHALWLGLVMMFFLFSERRRPPGLDRFPPQAQVRRHATVSILVLVALPVIAVEAWLLRGKGELVAAAFVSTLVLLTLSSLRHRLSVAETIRLYGAVEDAAGERGRLLADVVAHMEADRHRVAAHLHGQTVALYTAMTSFTASLEHAARAPDRSSTGATAAVERMRSELGHQVDELRQVATAVAPLPRAPGPGQPLAALVPAYVESLYGDAPKPDLVVEVDPDLALDWTTEAVVQRIVQEAVHNVWRHAGATRIQVTATGGTDRLRVEVVDDGVGAGDAPEGRGIALMEAVTGFIDGTLTVTRAPAGGTCVRAVVEAAAPSPPRPRLRLVRGG